MSFIFSIKNRLSCWLKIYRLYFIFLSFISTTVSVRNVPATMWSRARERCLSWHVADLCDNFQERVTRSLPTGFSARDLATVWRRNRKENNFPTEFIQSASECWSQLTNFVFWKIPNNQNCLDSFLYELYQIIKQKLLFSVDCWNPWPSVTTQRSGWSVRWEREQQCCKRFPDIILRSFDGKTIFLFNVNHRVQINAFNLTCSDSF